MNKIAVYLNRHLTGNVFDKDSILEAYSTDRSMLKVKPQLVALPETTSDIRKIVRFVRQLSEKKYSLPIAIRGSGLSKTGADLSHGIVLSTEKLNRVRELDSHDRLVHVQAGITLGKLNAILAPHGLTLPVHADPNETIGSLIANAPRDNYAGRYGGIMNYVDRAEIVLANGDLIQTSRLSFHKLLAKKNQKNLEGEIYEKLDELLLKHADLVAHAHDNTHAGYPALKHVRRDHGHVFDLLPVFFGSEGSLGIITEVILRLEVLPPRPHRIFALFGSLKHAQEFANRCLKLGALSTELFDNRIFKAVEDSGKKPDLLTRKFDDGFLVLAGFNFKAAKSARHIRHLVRSLPKSAYVVSETAKNSLNFDDFAIALSSFINETGKGERPNLLNDFFVPKSQLADFVDDLKNLEKSSKKHLELFGCYSTSIYSVRPDFDLKKVDDRRAALTLLRDFNLLLAKHGGSLAGGLPEGRLKPIVIYPELSIDERDLIMNVKKIFDEANILAPEIKSNYDTRSAVRHLRTLELPGIN